MRRGRVRSILGGASALALTLVLLVLAGRSGVRADEEASAGRLRVVAEMAAGPGNLTLLPDGRILASLHPFFEPHWRVVEVGKDGTVKAFPNEAWNRGSPDRVALDAVLGIQADARGVVWMLDNGLRGGVTPKLVAWDTRTERLHRVIHLPAPVTREDSFANDLAVDLRRDRITIADPAGGKNAALIVVDMESGAARRLLEGHVSVVPEDVDLVIDGTPVEIRLPDGSKIRPHVGVNPIALDGTNDWLYFGPMHGTVLYRVRTKHLYDEKLDAGALASKVEPYAEKPICDGISVDDEGNVYVSDIGNNAVGVIGKDRTYRVITRDDEMLRWPDAFSFGPDGLLYTVSNQLHLSARLRAGVDATEPPFRVLSLTPLAKGQVGR